MPGSFGIVGCGYVGSAVAIHLRHQGHEVVGTTTSPGRLCEIGDLVDHPRLYSAGELGSIYSYLYQGTGNIGECLAFGRIAARQAVAQTAWS